MRNLKKLTTVIALFCALFSTQNVQAQFSVGGALAYGTEFEDLGLQLRVGYGITENIDAFANFTTFFVGEDGVSFNTINLDGHYNFIAGDGLNAYGLGGLNVAIVDIDNVDTDPELGFNVGGGVNFGLTDNIGLFGELKYVISDLDQLVLNAGVLYSF